MPDEPLLVLQVELAAYSFEAIKKTCYRLADRLTIQCKAPSEGTVSLLIWPRNHALSVNEVRDQVLVELNDEELKEIVRKETETISQLILAQAFSKSSLVGK